MDVAQFEGIVRRMGYSPIGKVPTREGNILVAERLLQNAVDVNDEVVPFPHWEVLWCLERDGAKEGRTVRVPAYLNEIGGIHLPVPTQPMQRHRVQEAVKDAEEWLYCCKKVGRY